MIQLFSNIELDAVSSSDFHFFPFLFRIFEEASLLPIFVTLFFYSIRMSVFPHWNLKILAYKIRSSVIQYHLSSQITRTWSSFFTMSAIFRRTTYLYQIQIGPFASINIIVSNSVSFCHRTRRPFFTCLIWKRICI